MSKVTDKAKFDLIRYANCWEDADVLLKGLQPKKGAAIVSICSAGDNSLSLLTTQPSLLIAIDISAVQLYLTELKMVAIKNLEQPEYIQFVGIRPSNSRVKTFNSLKKDLSKEARDFWESKLEEIETGIIHAGKFERYFKFFRQWFLPFIHSKKNIHRLLESKSEQEQKEFYNKVWNNYRWQLMFRIFFSKKSMGKYGRDPEFLAQVNVPVAEYIFRKAEKQLTSTLAQENHFLRMIMKGEFGERLPHYARPENYKLVKENLRVMHLKKGLLEEVLPSNQKFDVFNLSNIFEYMNAEIFSKTAQVIANHSQADARVAYWNLMVKRRLYQQLPEVFQAEQSLSEQLTDIDCGFFYNRFYVDKKKA
ncbi:MAG: DUF3419 family protein [Bacteroidetes bacterium]|nr:DUF3419 family protein [Bacteroidota bacterium]